MNFRLLVTSLALCIGAWAQSNPPQLTVSTDPSNSNAPPTLTLQDALVKARQVNPEYRAAVTEYGLAKEDKVQSRAALLPNVDFTTSFLYTQGGGTLGVGRFIANNGVHEYVAEGNVRQVVSLENIAEYRRTRAAEAVARARAEIASRGLVVTVVQTYYGFIAAQRRYATVQKAAAESQHFFEITQKLESGGEVAHSDVVKAQIQNNEQQRQLQQARFEMDRTRLDLAVLVFKDFNQNFAAVDDMQVPEPVPSFSEVKAAAARNNPQLRAALASLQEARQEVAVAWNGFLPALSLDYFYGIDANQFTVNGPIDPVTGRPVQNLGYAATATLQIPIWNWGANISRVKQANLRRNQANVELSATQRELLANLQSFYEEAQTASVQLDSLRQSAQLAEESLRLTNLRYQAGEASALEVVDAQNTLTVSRSAYDDGQVRFKLALANLQTLTGNL
jgi:outer membrane protein TolC